MLVNQTVFKGPLYGLLFSKVTVFSNWSNLGPLLVSNGRITKDYGKSDLFAGPTDRVTW